MSRALTASGSPWCRRTTNRQTLPLANKKTPGRTDRRSTPSEQVRREYLAICRLGRVKPRSDCPPTERLCQRGADDGFPAELKRFRSSGSNWIPSCQSRPAALGHVVAHAFPRDALDHVHRWLSCRACRSATRLEGERVAVPAPGPSRSRRGRSRTVMRARLYVRLRTDG